MTMQPDVCVLNNQRCFIGNNCAPVFPAVRVMDADNADVHSGAFPTEQHTYLLKDEWFLDDLFVKDGLGLDQ